MVVKKKTIKIFGVAGSGKTTRCLEFIKNFLNEKYFIEEITFTTFTNAGLKSMKEKLENEGIELPYKNNFKTLNSLTWKLSGFTMAEIIKNSERNKFFKSIHIKTSKNENVEFSEAESIIDLYNKILNSEGKKLEDINNNVVKDYVRRYIEVNNTNILPFNILLTGLYLYNKWKNTNGKKDYVDSFIHVIENKIDIETPVLIVDEAQDLSKVQTMLIDLWTKEYDREVFMICGDDDQTIYEWNGASPKYLIEYTNENLEVIKLERSYRIPKKISLFLNNILKTIKYREKKEINTGKEGGVLKYYSLSEFKLCEMLKSHIDKEKTNFILCRTNYIKNKVSNLLFKETNIFFNELGQNFCGKWSEKFVILCNVLNKIDKRVFYLDYREVEVLFECLPEKTCLEEGSLNWLKNKKGKIKTEEVLSRTIWKDSINLAGFIENSISLKDRMIRYIEYKKSVGYKDIVENDLYKKKLMMQKNIIPFNYNEGVVKSNVFLGTFHSSKGLEAYNVFVFLGTSRHFNIIDDSEKRVFYVSCSRCLNSLTFIGSSMLGDEMFGLENEFLKTIISHIQEKNIVEV